MKEHRYTSRRQFLQGSAAAAGVSLLASRIASADTRAQRNHALLVAVTRYPDLPPRYSLAGPANDVALFRSYLLEGAPVRFEPKDVVTLAEEAGSDARPTLSSIRAAMFALAARAGPGDFVYLHFSGHGSQQPAAPSERAISAFDEVFLPRDARPRTGAETGIPNGYIDKVIGADIDRIRDAGAFVWALFDCCHSGTITRALRSVDSSEVDRRIDPRALGIPDPHVGARTSMHRSVLANRLQAAGDRLVTRSASNRGGLVAFFASQSIETTPEMSLPQGSENARQMGLFSFVVLQKLAQNPHLTYRQLGQWVHAEYAALNRQRPTPLFEGDLDRHLFDLRERTFVAQWPVRRLADGTRILPAGEVHRLWEGALLAVLQSPDHAIERALGVVEIEKADALSSRLREPVAKPSLSYDGGDDPPRELAGMDPADIPDGSFLRLLARPTSFVLRVSLPEADEATEEAAHTLALTLDQLAGDTSLPVALEIVETQAPADLRLVVMSAHTAASEAGADKPHPDLSDSETLRLWLLAPGRSVTLAPGSQPPSFPLTSETAVLRQWLRDAIVRVHHSLSLARIGAAGEFSDPPVQPHLSLVRSDGASTEIRLGDVPSAHPGDLLHLLFENTTSTPLDLAILFIGSDYSVAQMFAERFLPGHRADFPVLRFTGSSLGRERVIVVVLEAQPQTPVLDLSFLGQPAIRTRGGARSSPRDPGDGLAGLLASLGEAGGARTRSIRRRSTGGRGAVLVYSVETTPGADTARPQ